jgi:hypothetical protein
MNHRLGSFDLPPRLVKTPLIGLYSKDTHPNRFADTSGKVTHNCHSTIRPGRVADRHRLVAAPTVDYPQISQFRHCRMTAAQTVNDNLTLWINLTDGIYNTPDENGMTLTGQTVLSG